MLDLLIKNIKIIDGSGKPAYIGSVGVKGDKIVNVNGNENAIEIIDGAGLYLAPGFIDAHSHGDRILGSADAHLFKTNQGVTTEITGLCGLSVIPILPSSYEMMKTRLSTGVTNFPDDMKNWSSLNHFIDYANTQKLSANAKTYIGHSTLRIAVMGMENRPCTDKELDIMKGMLREAMEEGATGFSTGLIYTPSCYAEQREFIELAKVIEPFNGIYASHMRNEGDNLIDSVKETINIGRRAGVRVDISHHKALGKNNWGKQKQTLELIHNANDEGIFTFCDQYPYTWNNASLNVVIPPWHFSDGYTGLLEKLKDKSFRERLKKEIQDKNTPFENFYIYADGWENIQVCSAGATPLAEGKSIAEYANLIGVDPWTAYFDICQENQCKTSAIFNSMSEEDICEIISDPYCIVGSDGIPNPWSGKGHPRASATFPHAINYYVKEKGILSLEEMVRKMTGLTAEYLLVKNKGLIKEGYDADLVVFDYDNLKDTATYLNPNSLTEGINYVIVNGKIVYKDKKFTGNYSGRLVKHN